MIEGYDIVATTRLGIKIESWFHESSNHLRGVTLTDTADNESVLLSYNEIPEAIAALQKIHKLNKPCTTKNSST